MLPHRQHAHVVLAGHLVVRRIVFFGELFDPLDGHNLHEVALVPDYDYLGVGGHLLDLLDPVVLQLVEGAQLVDRIG